MTTSNEARGEVLGEGLKPTIAGGNASGSQDSDAHFT
jgi:hypothetical protein